MRADGLLRTGPGRRWLLLGAFGVLLAAMVAAVTFGSYPVSVGQVFQILGSRLGFGQADGEAAIIVWEIRLPRVLLSALVGAALALSGAVFQGIFRNPLVEPYILGVSSGAACGAALAIVLVGGMFSTGLFAFLFAMLAMGLAYATATSRKQTPLVSLLLAGTIVSSVFTSLLNYLKVAAPENQLREITFWLMGGFYTADWGKVALLGPLVLLGLAVLWPLGWKLNVMTMGDAEARSMGLSTGRLKLLFILLGTLLTALSVSQAGIISWVGLMIPHISRMTVGPDHRYLLPLSATLGGVFLVVCDTLARTLVMGELPISILTSILGAPYLIYLLRANRQVYFSE